MHALPASLDNCEYYSHGFTLIELSIVLVIIGLIIGGILTGQDLINTAAIRSQISQIQKYNTAVRTFQGKYGFLPGDIPNPYATQFGFQTRGNLTAEGDGNGMLGGVDAAGSNVGYMESAGETVMFWVDLSTAGLIDGSFNTASATTPPGADITGSAVANYLPQAKIGQGNSIYVWGGGTNSGSYMYTGINYFGLSIVPTIAASSDYGKVGSGAPGLTVLQAYNIDKKTDDGFPQSGNITAVYLWGATGDPDWTDGHSTLTGGPYTGRIAGATTTCYDNGYVNGATQNYSTEENGGGGMNCGLSFRLQ